MVEVIVQHQKEMWWYKWIRGVTYYRIWLILLFLKEFALNNFEIKLICTFEQISFYLG